MFVKLSPYGNCPSCGQESSPINLAYFQLMLGSWPEPLHYASMLWNFNITSLLKTPQLCTLWRFNITLTNSQWGEDTNSTAQSCRELIIGEGLPVKHMYVPSSAQVSCPNGWEWNNLYVTAGMGEGNPNTRPHATTRDGASLPWYPGYHGIPT